MKKYVTVYNFQVFELIKKGKEIYFVDKEVKEVIHANDITAAKLARVLNEDEEVGMYEFWYETEAETVETDAEL